MRVLMRIRRDAFDRPGGDTVQMQRTADALRARGIDVVVSVDPEPSHAGFDVVHLFNVTAPVEPWRHAVQARAHGVPVALSTVYWPWDEYLRHADPRPAWRRRVGPIALSVLDRVLPERSRLRARWGPRLVEARLGRARIQRELLESAGVWLPNARAEHDVLVRDFGVERPSVVVVNAVDPVFASADPEPFRERTGLRDFVLCAARIEPRKNPVAVVRAAAEVGLPVVLLGWIASEETWRQCREAARTPLVHVDQSPPEVVASAMAAASVHVLPSWFETPGLATLEAALAGTRVVTTDRGTAREYLGDLAHYCDPTDDRSVAAAVRAALAAPAPPALRTLVAARYTWDAAAAATIRGYETLLGGGAPRDVPRPG